MSEKNAETKEVRVIRALVAALNEEWPAETKVVYVCACADLDSDTFDACEDYFGDQTFADFDYVALPPALNGSEGEK